MTLFGFLKSSLVSYCLEVGVEVEEESRETKGRQAELCWMEGQSPALRVTVDGGGGKKMGLMLRTRSGQGRMTDQGGEACVKDGNHEH